MKTLVTIAILLLCCQLSAQTEKPPLDLPVYPGGSSSMEINMTAEELMQMLQAMLPMMGERMGKLAEALTPDAIADVLKDVRRIEYLQVDIPGKGVTDRQIAEFYARNLPAGQWSRVLWMPEAPNGAMGLYSQQDAEQLYGFRVSSVKVERKTIKRAMVAKIEGKIDYIKLLKLVVTVGTMLQQPPEPK